MAFYIVAAAWLGFWSGVGYCASVCAVKAWRRFLVALEVERSDLAHAPIYCGRPRW